MKYVKLQKRLIIELGENNFIQEWGKTINNYIDKKYYREV